MRQIKTIIQTVLATIHSYIKPENNSFFEAIHTGKHAEVKKLLKTSRVNSFSQNGQTPLGYACANLDLEMVNLLLQAGANPNIYQEKPPLLYALQTAQNWHNIYGLQKDIQDALKVHEDNATLIFKSLVEAQADITYTDKKGSNLLMIAAYSGNDKVFQLLIDLGADTLLKNKDGKDVFTYALMGENKTNIQLLCNIASLEQLHEYKKQILDDYKKATEINDLIDTLLIYHTLDKNLVASKVTKPRKI